MLEDIASIGGMERGRIDSALGLPDFEDQVDSSSSSGLESKHDVLDALCTVQALKATIAVGPRWNLEGFLETMNKLSIAHDILEKCQSVEGVEIARTQLEVGLAGLEEEFGDALEKHSKPLTNSQLQELAVLDGSKVIEMGSSSLPASPTSSEDATISSPTRAALLEWLPANAVPYLHRMAEEMHKRGAGERCIAIYKQVRARALEQSMINMKLKYPPASELEDVQWSEMATIMKSWMRNVNILVKVLIAGEAALIGHIMDGLTDDLETPLKELYEQAQVNEFVTVLLRACRSIASGRKLPERVFSLLDMFVVLQKVEPRILSMTGQSETSQMTDLLKRLPSFLSEAASGTFEEFRRILDDSYVTSAARQSTFIRFPWRNQVSEAEEVLPPDGSVHATTSYVVNYVKPLLVRGSTRNYGACLDSLLGLPNAGAEQCGQLLEALEHSLHRLAASSLDAPLRELFLMNNLLYMQQSMLTVGASHVLPTEVIEEHAMKFRKAALGKVTAILTEPHQSLLAGLSDARQDCKRRLRKFNDAFEELALQQGTWVVVDEERRRRMRHEWSAELKDIYASFLLPHRDYLVEIRSYRYSPNSIERVVLDYFFLGS